MELHIYEFKKIVVRMCACVSVYVLHVSVCDFDLDTYDKGTYNSCCCFLSPGCRIYRVLSVLTKTFACKSIDDAYK